jgi:hypothetical protein
MGVFHCARCGDPSAYNSWSPAGMVAHDAVCPMKDGPPKYRDMVYQPNPPLKWDDDAAPQPPQAPTKTE